MAAITKLGKEVVEYIDRLLTKQNKNFETNKLKFDEDLDLTKNFRPDPETLDYHVDEIINSNIIDEIDMI